jgi:hypothetical protein
VVQSAQQDFAHRIAPAFLDIEVQSSREYLQSTALALPRNPTKRRFSTSAPSFVATTRKARRARSFPHLRCSSLDLRNFALEPSAASMTQGQLLGDQVLGIPYETSG